jgi:hypothetical protein
LKRVLVLSDLHSGHRVGLTPPKYQNAIPGQEYYRIQIETWDWFKATIEALKPIHTVICNGDAIDGKGARSEGVEQITGSISTQIDMAVEALKVAEAKHYVIVAGTPYHTGAGEDAEQVIADKLGGRFHDHAKYKINGTVFSCKHKVGSSSIPHGKGTPIARERLWDLLWTEWDESDAANVIIRSHVHYFYFCGEAHWLGMTTPALQGLGSRYGARQCSGVVHFGMVHFDCMEDGTYSWSPHLLRAISQKRIVYEL